MDPALGRSRDYLIDLSPKFVMSRGELVKLLVYTGVANYLNWGGVDGSFVFNTKKLYRVPGTPREMVTSGLVSLMQKNRLRKFGEYLIKIPAAALESPKSVSYTVTYEGGSLGISMDATGNAQGTAAVTKVVPGGQSAAKCAVGDILVTVGDVNVSQLPYPEVLATIKAAVRPVDVRYSGQRVSDEAKAATLPAGGPPGGPKAVTMQALYEHFWLNDTTADFVGHAMALQRDESYKSKCAAPTMAACKVYVDSLATMVQVCFYLPLHFKRILLTILTCPPHILTFKNIARDDGAVDACVPFAVLVPAVRPLWPPRGLRSRVRRQRRRVLPQRRGT